MIRVTATYGENRLQNLDQIEFQSGSAAGLQTIQVNFEEQYQEILGFGASFTDSSCYMMGQLPESEQKSLLHDFFSQDEMGLNVCRLSIGASDYARTCFSYDDTVDDFELKDFSIDYDREYVIPITHKALAENPDMVLFSSPWSPPGWMKTGGSMLGGWMRDKYLEVYAQYFLRYLQAYQEAGIHVAAVTPQNELETDQHENFPGCFWHPEQEMSFVRDHLVPLLKQNGFDTKVWIMDHDYRNWKRAKWMLDDEDFKSNVDGTAFHGYFGTVDKMTLLHEAHPDKHLYWTEGGPNLGEAYETEWCEWGRVFTEVTRNWGRSITAWNLALDETGGPKIGPWPCAGLVTIDSKTGQLTHSGQYWALGHFSRYIKRGARRVFSSEVEGMENVAFVNPNNETVVVITNPGEARDVQLQVNHEFATVHVPENAVLTLTWN